MHQGLRFNLCGLESSYLRNLDVSGLDQRIKPCIPLHLSYSCRFWADHMQNTAFDSKLAVELKTFASIRVLFWLEALSLLGSVSTAFTALTTMAKWVAGQSGYKDTQQMASDLFKFVQTFGVAISYLSSSSTCLLALCKYLVDTMQTGPSIRF